MVKCFGCGKEMPHVEDMGIKVYCRNCEIAKKKYPYSDLAKSEFARPHIQNSEGAESNG